MEKRGSGKNSQVAPDEMGQGEFTAIQTAPSLTVKLGKFGTKVHERLARYDDSGQGELSRDQLAAAIEGMLIEEAKMRNMRWYAAIAIMVAAVVLAANVGLTFSVVQLSQETQVRSDVLLSKDTGKPVQTGSTDIEVRGATMYSRNEGLEIIKTGDVSQPSELHSLLPDRALDALKTLKVKNSATEATLSLQVLGWARVPTGTGRNVVKLITQPGIVTVDGSSLEFHDILGNLFEEAGFAIDSTGRKLLGIYELIGLFNSIADWENLEESELEPGFHGSFHARYTVRYPCAGDGRRSCSSWSDGQPMLNVCEEGVICIGHEAWHDEATGAVLEQLYNSEWPLDSLVTFKSPVLAVQAQRHLLDDSYHFCSVHALNPEGPEAGTTLGWNVSRAEKVGERLLEDGSTVEREFRVEMLIDIITYSLVTGDVTGDGYDGIATLAYFDDKATATPRRFVYGNGVEIRIDEYSKQDVDLSAWDAPVCLADPTGVSRMTLAPYQENRALRNPALLEPPVTSSRTAPLVPGGIGRRHLLLDEEEWQNCNPAGTCQGSREHVTFAKDFKVTEVDLSFWKEGCGPRSLSLTGNCGGGQCNAACSGESPLLCQSNGGLSCFARIDWTLRDFVGGKVGAALDFLGIGGKGYIEAGYETRELRIHEMDTYDGEPFTTSNQALQAIQALLLTQGKVLGYSEVAHLYFEAYGEVDLLSCGLGCWGLEANIGGGIDLYLNEKRWSAHVTVGGRACLGLCVGGEWDIVDPGTFRGTL